MHATSTPTLAQPKNGAFAALGAAAILTAAIGFGAVIGLNLPTVASPTAGAGSATQIESGLAAKNAGTAAAAAVDAGSATQIESGLAAKNAGTTAAGTGSALAIEQGLAAKSDEGLNAAVAAESFAIGGRDPQAGFNNAAIDPVAEYNATRAAAGWYPVAPVVDPVAEYNAARAAAGWYPVVPSVVLSYDQIREMDGWKPFATVPQAPATDLGDIVPGLGGSGSVVLSNDQIRAMAERHPFPTLRNASEGNTDKVGTTHR